MAASERIEHALLSCLNTLEDGAQPPRLATAMRHAVFPGGARIRPTLVLAVAQACGEDDGGLSEATAAAIELLHCASLVHDDLPCFDDAATRRGQPSVHRLFGERLAVLAGDALIVLAYDTLARGCRAHLSRLPGLIQTLCQGVGMPRGIAAGQAWECEPQVDLRVYQEAKTGALFAAATMAGAQAAGADPQPWRALGLALGAAYQVADDIRDAVGDAQQLGKPVLQDITRDRPSMTRELGLPGALQEFRRLMRETEAAVPPCPGAAGFRALIRHEAQRLLPDSLANERTAARRAAQRVAAC